MSALSFDPRSVPVWRSATQALQQAPPVAPQRLHAQALRERFATALPWQAETQPPPWPAVQELRHAAVLLGLQAQADDASMLQVILTQRTAHLRDHSGQIALPGGKADAQDANATATALREAHEEIGLEPHCAQVLGLLPECIIGTGFCVTPVVALVQGATHWRPDPCEVAEVFCVPLPYLMTPAHHRKHRWRAPDGVQREWFSMPWEDPKSGTQRFIWGATAGILRNLYRFLSA